MADTSQQTKALVRDDLENVTIDGVTLPVFQMGKHFYFLHSLPIHMVDLDKEAQPREYNESQAQRIAQSIERKVLMQPVLARWDSDSQKFLITEGQHRWHAMRDFLKADKLPAIVYLDMEKELAILCGLEANAEDRSKALSAADAARKRNALMYEFSDLLRREKPGEEPTEMAVLERMGHVTKKDQSSFLLGVLLEGVQNMGSARIRKYIADKQSKEKPLTYRTFGSFVTRLAKLTAIQADETDLREEELENVLRISDMFAQSLFESGKWSPDDPDSKEHRHAINVCRWHPIEACGHFVAKAIERSGGRDVTLGTLYVPHSSIDWSRVEEDIQRIVLDTFWDADHVWPVRNVNKLIELLDAKWRVSLDS
ncbi:MAG: ParB N-terminal domain-containing protein [Chloroflexi bacterium]|nr:ParB N-terminal domain-containing protein [Chloroflexota bacterium]